MSASPAGAPNGQSAAANPAPQRVVPKRRDNPLVARKARPQRPTGPPTNRAPTLKGPAPTNTGKPSPQPLSAQQKQAQFETKRKQNGGWWEPAPPGAKDFPIVTTKRALREGLRHHVMKFWTPHSHDKPIDPTDQDEFTRPVTLHRRDPRQPPPGRQVKEEIPEPTAEEIEEAEKKAQEKAAKEAQRAADQAQVAPVTKDLNPKTKQPKKVEKTTQVYNAHKTEKQKREQDIRYTEALPWHLEDVDGKNVWVGSYIAPLSDKNVALVIHNGGFRMIPLERWYKFTAKPPFETMTAEEAEKAMNRPAGMARWAMRDQKRQEREQALEASRTIMNGRVAIKQESNTFMAASRGEKMDHDDIDMSGDEFQDDDENPGLELDRDEDAKDSRDRVRRDQMGANLFGDANEKEVEKEEEDQKKEDLERRKFGKQTVKALKKIDKTVAEDVSEDDSERERDPFAPSSSESESESDSEVKKEDDANEGDKDKAGASSKGSNTPTGKKNGADAAKKGKNLKRPGSPNLSESSGNESSRKHKKLATSAGVSRGSTPLPGSQLGRNVGSTSDGEATAGEMSDGAGGKKKKLVRNLGTGAKATPSGSRAGSPIPSQGKLSPTKGGGSTPRAGSPAAATLVEAHEIVAALPTLPNGVSIGTLMRSFGNRVGDNPGQMPRKDWIKLVKENSVYSSSDKLLRRKA